MKSVSAFSNYGVIKGNRDSFINIYIYRYYIVPDRWHSEDIKKKLNNVIYVLVFFHTLFFLHYL